LTVTGSSPNGRPLTKTFSEAGVKFSTSKWRELRTGRGRLPTSCKHAISGGFPLVQRAPRCLSQGGGVAHVCQTSRECAVLSASFLLSLHLSCHANFPPHPLIFPTVLLPSSWIWSSICLVRSGCSSATRADRSKSCVFIAITARSPSMSCEGGMGRGEDASREGQHHHPPVKKRQQQRRTGQRRG